MWTSEDPKFAAGLTLFSVRDIPMANVQQAILKNDRIYIRTMTTGNLNAVRAATHIYNMPSEVDHLIASVKHVAENSSRYMTTTTAHVAPKIMRRIRRRTLPLILATTSGGWAQPPATLTFHDLSTMQRHPLGRMQARGAMGQTGSIMVTELPPGLKTAPHHHHQEQMMLGLDGGMHYQMAGKPYPLGRLTAAIALPNVEHGNINETAA